MHVGDGMWMILRYLKMLTMEMKVIQGSSPNTKIQAADASDAENGCDDQNSLDKRIGKVRFVVVRCVSITIRMKRG